MPIYEYSHIYIVDGIFFSIGEIYDISLHPVLDTVVVTVTQAIYYNIPGIEVRLERKYIRENFFRLDFGHKPNSVFITFSQNP